MSQPEPNADALAALCARFEAAGLVIPADLRAGTLNEAAGLALACALVRQPRTAAREPSNIFSLVGRVMP